MSDAAIPADDDPVGAVAVHGVGGTFGVISVGLFANGVYGNGWNLAVDDNGEAIPLKGVFYGEFGSTCSRRYSRNDCHASRRSVANRPMRVGGSPIVAVRSAS